MANCPLCKDTGKRMQANGQPGAYLGCSCVASLERAGMHFAASKFVIEYPLGGDNLDDDLAWFIHQRAKALGRSEALAELHPLWLAEKERAERAEAQLAEAPCWISVDERLPEKRDRSYQVFAICKKTYAEGTNYAGQGIKGVYQDWVIRQWPGNYAYWSPILAVPASEVL